MILISSLFHLSAGKEAICIFPIKNATGLKFVIGIDNKLFLANVTGSLTNLKSEITALTTVSNTGEEFTKGKVDNKGRLWYGKYFVILSKKYIKHNYKSI